MANTITGASLFCFPPQKIHTKYICGKSYKTKNVHEKLDSKHYILTDLHTRMTVSKVTNLVRLMIDRMSVVAGNPHFWTLLCFTLI